MVGGEGKTMWTCQCLQGCSFLGQVFSTLRWAFSCAVSLDGWKDDMLKSGSHGRELPVNWKWLECCPRVACKFALMGQVAYTYRSDLCVCSLQHKLYSIEAAIVCHIQDKLIDNFEQCADVFGRLFKVVYQFVFHMTHYCSFNTT